MLATPECYKRRCKHYIGVVKPDGTERTEHNVCAAFPEGIPKEISYGNNMHSKPLPKQGNNIVYEMESKE